MKIGRSNSCYYANISLSRRFTLSKIVEIGEIILLQWKTFYSLHSLILSISYQMKMRKLHVSLDPFWMCIVYVWWCWILIGVRYNASKTFTATNFALSTVWISHKNSFHFGPTLYESILRSYIKQRFTTIFFLRKFIACKKSQILGVVCDLTKLLQFKVFFRLYFHERYFQRADKITFFLNPHLVLHFFKLAFWLDFILFLKILYADDCCISVPFVHHGACFTANMEFREFDE